MLKEINPSKFAKIINKAVLSNRGGCMTTNIRKHKFKRSTKSAQRFRVRESMALDLLTRITNCAFIQIIHKQNIIFAKNIMNYCLRRMAKTIVPPQRGNLGNGASTFIQRGTQQIEPPVTSALKQRFLCCAILNKSSQDGTQGKYCDKML